MNSSTRLFLLLGAALAAATPLARPGGSDPQRTSVESAADPAKLLEGFRTQWSEWRGGKPTDLVKLRALAEECDRVGKRPDYKEVLAAYETLTEEQRREGDALEKEVDAVRKRLHSANARGLKGEAWFEERDELEPAMDDLWSRSRDLADRGARAKASELRAEYWIACVERPHAPLPEEEVRRVLDAAEQDARDAIADYQAFRIVRGRLNPLKSLARIERYWGRLSAAKETYAEVARIAGATGEAEEEKQAHLRLLAIARECGDTAEVERCIESLGKLARARPDWDLVREWCMQKLHEDRPAEAAEYLDKLCAGQPEWCKEVSAGTEFHYVRALLHLRLGELESAQEQAEAAAPQKQSTGKISFQQAFLEGRIALAAGRPEAALALIEACVPQVPRRPRDQGAARALLGEARLAVGDPAGAAREFERVLELAESHRRRLLIDSLADRTLLGSFNVLGESEGAGLETVSRLAQARLALGDPIGAALACEDWQSRALRTAVGRRRAGAVQGNPQGSDEPLTREMLAAWVDLTEQGLVTWIFGADSAVVVHVRRGPNGELDAAGAELGFGRRKAFAAVSRVVDDVRHGFDPSRSAAALADKMFPEPVRSRLREAARRGAVQGIERPQLLLLLHGPMEAAPVDYLPLFGPQAGEDVRLLTLPGLPRPLPRARPSAEAFRAWTLLGDPVDPENSNANPRSLLPLAGEELSTIARLWDAAGSLRPARFTGEELIEALRGSRCLHIATHLQDSGDSREARFSPFGLRLDGGRVFSPSDIAAIGPNLPLVVLSACDTGGGRFMDSEGLIGVARAFLEGGTRNLVVTLWPVADGAARDFSVELHRALHAGRLPSEAVRAARKALRDAGRSPGDWAAFRLIGQD